MKESPKLKAADTSRMEELPGAISEGDTLEEARENLRDAIEQLLEANRQMTATSKLGKKVTRETIAVSLDRL